MWPVHKVMMVSNSECMVYESKRTLENGTVAHGVHRLVRFHLHKDLRGGSCICRPKSMCFTAVKFVFPVFLS